MELAEVVRRRRMVRAYDPSRPVPADDVEWVLRSALRAPSAGFTQGVSLLVLDAHDQRSTFWAATSDPAGDNSWLRGMRTAPVLILIWTSPDAYLDRYAEPDKGWTDRDPQRWSAPYWFVDAGMTGMAMLLAAVDRGLGCCFFGIPPARIAAVRAAFGVPVPQLSVGVVSLGYPAPGGSRGSARRRPRKPADELLHRGHWNPAMPRGL
ncbi:hypothetical protein GCM10009841_34280 [Microlunatus panaciterrae]|uniref:Nitroreductase n=1 Tax=Microlunatus panaciterrae TaxID=400768 RepID=A0ABS2RGG4_9ACTN|nr:nitroreductase family protein [Microlunatus panaciterrae]MBM7798086.1 nitroreductase [Microlunatus panaciterrae]